jgi:hypothetical protein
MSKFLNVKQKSWLKLYKTFPSEVVTKGECPVWNLNSRMFPKGLSSHLNLRCLNYVNTNLYLVSINSTRNVTFATIHSWKLRHSDCSQYFIHIIRNWTLVLKTPILLGCYAAFSFKSYRQYFQDGTDICFETSLRNTQYSLPNNTEECNSHLFRGGSLKLLISQVFLPLYIAAELGLWYQQNVRT